MAKLLGDFFEDFVESRAQKAGLEENNGGKFFSQGRKRGRKGKRGYTLLYYIGGGRS